MGILFCPCNRDVGPFFSYCYRCPENGVRNPIRNALHRELKARIADILKVQIATANLNRRVLDGEPRLENYFTPPTGDLPDPAQVEFQYDGRGFEVGVKDFAVQMTDLTNDLIIDFTFVVALMVHITKLVKPY